MKKLVRLFSSHSRYILSIFLTIFVNNLVVISSFCLTLGVPMSESHIGKERCFKRFIRKTALSISLKRFF